MPTLDRPPCVLRFLAKTAASTLGALLMTLPTTSTRAAGPLPTYADDVAFLRQHTEVIELKNDGETGVVAVCPKWQGRVMTSTFEPKQGPSLGWVNRPFIEAGKNDKVFNNYGGAERFWLSPEAGQFALFFEPGKPQTLANWLTPVAMNEVEFKSDVVLGAHASGGNTKRLRAEMELTNYAGSQLSLSIARDIRYAGREVFQEQFGPKAGKLLAEDGVKLVGFQSDSSVSSKNSLTKAQGLVSIWTLGQFQPGPANVIILPYRAGPASELGPVVTTRYFGEIPAERLRDLGNVLLFRGDAQYRSKVGLSPRRSRSLAAAMNFEAEVLTIVRVSAGPADSRNVYLNNLWDLPQQDPFQGDAINSYNDGPTAPGEASLGGFFELETLSSARELRGNGDELRHVNTTYHVQADLKTLDRIAQEILGVSLDEMRAFLRP